MRTKSWLRWRMHVPWILLCMLLYTLPMCVNSLPSRFDSSETYIYDDSAGKKHLCLKCPPGMFRTSHCTSTDSVDHCKPCPLDTFKWSYDQATHCQICKSHCYKLNERKVPSSCNSTQDIVCECRPGFFRRREDCYPHDPCRAGQGVLEKGTKDRNTQCGPCVSGKTYSEEPSLTEPCKECVLPACNESSSTVDCRVDRNYVCVKSTVSGNPHQNPNRPEWIISTEAVIGIVIGILSVIVVVGLIVYCKCCRKRTTNGTTRSPTSDLCEALLSRKEKIHHIFKLIENGIDVRSWKPFVRSLPGNHMNDAELDRLIKDNPNSVNDQIHEALRTHAGKNPNIPLDAYIQALRECDQNSLAEKVEAILNNNPVTENTDGVSTIENGSTYNYM